MGPNSIAQPCLPPPGPPSSPSSRPPMLHRRLFPSSDSSSQYEEDSGLLKPQDSLSRSDGGTTESEFRSAMSSTAQAPIARLESMDELETSQERIWRLPSKEKSEEGELVSVQPSQSQKFFSEV